MTPDKEASSYLYKPVRTEADVRAARPISMLDVIRTAAMPHDLGCPFCGGYPLPAKQIGGKHHIACENPDCWASVQVSAPTLAGAWKLWNARAV